LINILKNICFTIRQWLARFLSYVVMCMLLDLEDTLLVWRFSRVT